MIAYLQTAKILQNGHQKAFCLKHHPSDLLLDAFCNETSFSPEMAAVEWWWQCLKDKNDSGQLIMLRYSSFGLLDKNMTLQNIKFKIYT